MRPYAVFSPLRFSDTCRIDFFRERSTHARVAAGFASNGVKRRNGLLRSIRGATAELSVLAGTAGLLWRALAGDNTCGFTR